MITPAIYKGKCQHCGGNLIVMDEDGTPYCLVCGRPIRSLSDWGKLGGLTTLRRYGKEYMRELGRRGGLSKGMANAREN